MIFDPTEENKLDPMTKTASPIDLRSYLTDLYKQKNLGDDKRMELEKSAAESKPGAGLTFLASLGAGLAGRNQSDVVNTLNQGARDKQKELEDFDKKRTGVFDELKRDREIGKFETDQKDELESSDPNSDKSKMMQALAARLMPNQDFSKYNAKQLGVVMERLETVSKQTMEDARRREDLAFKDKELGVKSQETKMKIDMAKEEKALADSKKLTKGEEAVDRNFAKDYDEWTTTGKPSAEKSIAKLEEAMNKLQKLGDKSTISGRFAGRAPDFLKSQEAVDLRDTVRSAANDALKATLGSQFTEKEGERIMKQSYDETLNPSFNVKRIQSALDELKANAANRQARTRYYEDNGTLKGFKFTEPQEGQGQGPLMSKQNSGAPSKPKTVKQNGITYTLNEATGEYE
jgi:hypothetical protein